MDHRRPTVFVAVPLSLLLQCLVARDTKSVAIVRARRFVVGLPSLQAGRGRAAVGARDDTATVVGHDGLCRPRFEEDDDDDRGPLLDRDGCSSDRHDVHYEYDVLFAVIVNMNEQYESLMQKLAFIRDDQKRFHWAVPDGL